MPRIAQASALAARFAVAGAALALLETGILCAGGRLLAYAVGDISAYAAAAVSSLVALCVIAGAVAMSAIGIARTALARANRPELLPRILAIAAAALSFPLGWLALWLLTEGRRVRDMPARGLWVALAALLMALAVSWTAKALADLMAGGNHRHRAWAAAALFAGAAIAMLTDALVLPRIYPAFHWALAAATACCMLCAAAVSPLPPVGGRYHRAAFAAGGISLLLTLAAPIALSALQRAANAQVLARHHAPVTGKLLDLAGPWLAKMPPAGSPAASSQSAGQTPTKGSESSKELQVPARYSVSSSQPPSEDRREEAEQQQALDLRGADILLITVDALRADRVAAYGGSGLTPHIDALAANSVVFTRAYTPSPHTSYGLTSLLTGKFVKPVMKLQAASAAKPETAGASHPTLPELLGRHGYRTAGFYPPAVFYVDRGQFAAFLRSDLGFQYRKVMFASAQKRVSQLGAYLKRVPFEEPIFVWVHLFEAHEPYDPPERFERGSSMVERYDGEVAAADHSVGRLVAQFRKARPGSTVILTADHGEEFGDHGGYYHGTTLYEEQIRVPLLWSSPGLVQHRAVDRPVELVDIATTLLAVLGIPRDARMRGEDLRPAMRGISRAAPSYAFSEIRDLKMVCDGRYKAICATGRNDCELYDLVADPTERNNLGLDRPEIVQRLRGALGQFVTSISEVEAAATEGEDAANATLARAQLGDPLVGPDLIPLLGSERAAVRAAAARWCGELGNAPALPVLSRLRTEDPNPGTRSEAAVAALRLGDGTARAQVAQLLDDLDDSPEASGPGSKQSPKADAGSGKPRAPGAGATSGRPTAEGGAKQRTALELAQAAALALSDKGDARGAPLLVDLAKDTSANRESRLRAIAALGATRHRNAVSSLIALLKDPMLRIDVVQALGRIGGRRAANALVQALSKERYAPAREAEVQALAELRDRRALPLIKRFLGTEPPIDNGVQTLLSLGGLRRTSGEGVDLRRSPGRVLRGPWHCTSDGCTPRQRGSASEGEAPQAPSVIRLPPNRAPLGPARAFFLARAETADETLTVNGQAARLRGAEQQAAFDLPPSARRTRQIEVATTPGVRLLAVVVVPRSTR